MNSFASPASLPPPPVLAIRPARSAFVTTFGWGTMGVSALLSTVSLAALLMILAGSHGSANGSLLGGFVVIGVPPLTLVAGMGLLRRLRWAYAYMILLLGSIAIWNVGEMLRGPTPQYTYTSPTGVPTTVLATHVDYPLHLLVTLAVLVLLAKLLTGSVRREFGGRVVA